MNPLLANRDVVGHILALKHCNNINLLWIRPTMAPAKFLCGYCNHKPFCQSSLWAEHLQSSARCASLMNDRCTCNDCMSSAHKHIPSSTVRGPHKDPKSANKAQHKCNSFLSAGQLCDIRTRPVHVASRTAIYGFSTISDDATALRWSQVDRSTRAHSFDISYYT